MTQTGLLGFMRSMRRIGRRGGDLTIGSGAGWTGFVG